MKDLLVNKIERYCPICDNVHELEVRTRTAQGLVKGEAVEYEEIYFLCALTDEEDNEFVPAKIMDDNLLKARDAYRRKKGLLTSKEIASIRQRYGMTQSDFALLLGWGEVTITRYESKSIQDETYDNIIRLTYENPLYALENLEKHKSSFTIEKYETLRARIVEQIIEQDNLYFIRNEIFSYYVDFQKQCVYNGGKLLDIEKTSNVIGYFAAKIHNLYKVKLMKLLWYADALHYRRYNASITGLVYTQMTYGALPLAYNEIIRLPSVDVYEEINFENISFKILPRKPVTDSAFSQSELEVLQAVIKFFSDYSTKDIIEYMHQEPAYLETEPKKPISFSLARRLRELS